MLKKKKILVTGSDGRFGKVLQKLKKKNIIFRNKKQLNILSINSIRKNLKKFKPNYILHLAGLSRPMKIHDKQISKSIDLIINNKELPEYNVLWNNDISKNENLNNFIYKNEI